MGDLQEIQIEEASEAEDIKMSKCTRCGKERIVKNSHVEKSENNSIVYTTTVCPDPKCQELVEKGLITEEKQRKFIRDKKENRFQEIASKKRLSKAK